MHLSHALLALCLLFGVRASQLGSRVPHTLDIRELLDVCTTITNDLLDPNSFNFVYIFGLLGASISTRMFSPDGPV